MEECSNCNAHEFESTRAARHPARYAQNIWTVQIFLQCEMWLAVTAGSRLGCGRATDV
jgi:hypothetical protein